MFFAKNVNKSLGDVCIFCEVISCEVINILANFVLRYISIITIIIIIIITIIIIIIIIIITLFQVDEIKIQHVIQVTYTR